MALVGTDPGQRVRGKGAKAVAFQSDQADTIRAPALIDGVVAHFGGLDILANNAAISVEQGRKADHGQQTMVPILPPSRRKSPRISTATPR
ncbi:hypothetical protein [Streptomyces spirodelae]|uniref:hypothetical protein n=1 Tax=Streptomyces spirodelae TaxID=2812904 RepID=UPI001E4D2F91|nr:hypothetical protein [Streptomyces spirodelae]